jgi:glutamate-ammonia-ligase adenylyltransferase
VTPSRSGSVSARLARLGFTEPARSAALLEGGALGPLLDDEDVLLDLAGTADPDEALHGLASLLDADAGNAGRLVTELGADEVLRHRLFAVLGASRELSDFLARHPEQWSVLRSSDDVRPTSAGLRRSMLLSVDADPDRSAPTVHMEVAAATDQLRIAYRNRLLQLAARDVAEGAEVADVAAELADLAGATLEAALAIARTEVGDAAATCRLAVIAMGKCGGRELNYVSDVDVVFVAEAVDDADEAAALKTAATLAATMPPCGRRARPVRWYARWPATSPTTSGGPRPGSSRRCSRPGRSPETWHSDRRTSRAWRRWCGTPPTARTSSPTCSRCGAGSRRRCRQQRATAS